jgi:hypothetical protein
MMMELAIGLVLAGALVALLMPLLALQRDSNADRKDVLAMEQARAALLGQAVAGGGLPAPIEFAESSSNGVDDASSHLTLDASLAALPLGWAGALPGQALGVPHISSVQTAYWYDAQPALRADAATAFSPKVTGTGGTAMFFAIVDQFDPDQNPTMSTGGYKTQLCRNLNSLLDIEQNIRTGKSNYSPAFLRVTLPRVWAAGNENRFSWNSTAGYSDIAAATPELVFANSAAAALVVVKRQPPALRRLDRQNTVYQQVPGSGLDKPLTDRGVYAYPADLSAVGGSGFRVYENTSTPAADDPTLDTADYAGLVQSVSLGEFAQSLRGAGLCTKPSEACKANQLFVRFSNSVRSAPPSGLATGLPMRWSLVDVSGATTYQTGDVAKGAATDGVCMDAFGTDAANTAPSRYLRLSFISPAGTEGYTSGDNWFLGGVLVDPDNTQASADAGVTRWRPLTALSAAEAGKTVTVSCTGTHTVSAELPAGELSRGGALPTCSVTQLP